MPVPEDQPKPENPTPAGPGDVHDPVGQTAQERQRGVGFLRLLQKRLRGPGHSEQADVRDIYPLF